MKKKFKTHGNENPFKPNLTFVPNPPPFPTNYQINPYVDGVKISDIPSNIKQIDLLPVNPDQLPFKVETMQSNEKEIIDYFEKKKLKEKTINPPEGNNLLEKQN